MTHPHHRTQATAGFDFDLRTASEIGTIEDAWGLCDPPFGHGESLMSLLKNLLDIGFDLLRWSFIYVIAVLGPALLIVLAWIGWKCGMLDLVRGKRRVDPVA